MSAVFEDSRGFVLDPRGLIDQGYRRCIRFKDNQKSHVKCRFKKRCFQVLKGHYGVSAGDDVHGGNMDVLQKTDKPSKVHMEYIMDIIHGVQYTYI